MLPLIFLVVGVFAQQTLSEEPEAIVGGQPAAPGEFPWQGSLRVNGQHSCGASIIAPTKILTAAHCVHGIVSAPYSNLKVATGSIQVNQGQLHVVKKVVEHPGYISSSKAAWVNDIAVITLASPIQYNQYQSPIALADSQPIDGQQCTLSGWGKISTHGSIPRNLLYMKQAVISLSQCNKRYFDVTLTNSHLCAYKSYGIGACQGDSGGPLVSNGKQIGITSFSVPCAQGEPDVYTNVYHHRDFIKRS